MKLRSVFKCYGGKSYLKDFIISHFPPNFNEMTYIEGFLGAGSTLLNKPKSKIEIGNDIDPSIVNIFFQLIHNPTEFIKQVKLINYTEESFENAKINCHQIGLEGAVAELCVRRMSRGGMCKAFSWSERLRGGIPGDVNAFETFKDHLELIAERLKDVKIECKPAIELIDQYDSEDSFFYCDPPYLPSTRQSNGVYTFEMTEKDHIELLEKINTIKGKVALSGYPSSLYEKHLKGWNLKTMPIANHSSQVKQKEKRIECLWLNY